jgi:hypothetical protein
MRRSHRSAPRRRYSFAGHAPSVAEIMWLGTYLPLAGSDVEEEDEVMFSAHCPQHGGEVLLPERRIESVRNTTCGIEVRWVCYCGHRGTFMTGRRRDHATHIA